MKLNLSVVLAAATLAPANAVVNTLQCTQVKDCEQKTINFEEFARGEYLEQDTFADCGLSSISVKKHNGSGNYKVRIFDTEDPVGNWDAPGADPKCSSATCDWKTTGTCEGDIGKCGDDDLYAPFTDLITGEGGLRPHKVMIHDEAYLRGGSDLDKYPPDDSWKGARFVLEWSRPVTLHNIEFLDIEHHESKVSDITLFYAGTNNKNSTEVLETGDGKMHVQPILHGGNVIKAEIRIGGSGAISSLAYTYDDEPCFDDGDKDCGAGGDPHFQPWKGPKFSFHGECDLVLMQSDMFHENAGLDIHARTTIQDYFSYIETAAVRIGDDVLEMHPETFILNGKSLENLPVTFGSRDRVYSLEKAPLKEGQNPNYYNNYRLHLGDGKSILFKFYKKFLTLTVEGRPTDLKDAKGLLGEYGTGALLDRRGLLISDPTAFGFEWQVQKDEPKLFQEDRSPQLPYERCRMPTAARPTRRLRGKDAVLFESAKEACGAHGDNDFDLCVEDVMATGDLGIAELW